MAELLGLVPSQVTFIAHLGRQAAGYAMQQASEQLGHEGARRNAQQAYIENCARHVGESILGCEVPWNPDAIQHLELPKQPRAMQQQAVERSSLPQLEALRDRLHEAQQGADREAVMPLVQHATKMAERAAHIFLPLPREPDD